MDRPSVRGEYRINAVRQWGDCTRAEDLSHAALEGRRLVWVYFDWLKANFPEFEKAHIIDTGLQIGTRESRRIMGDYVLTLADVKQGWKPADTIALGAHGIDIHSTRESSPDHRMDWLSAAYGIPYRCLLPLGLENLLVSGRCISVTHEALASTRVMVQCMEIGQAAGTAAALSIRQSCTPRQLDPTLLCRTLENQGVLLQNGVPISPE